MFNLLFGRYVVKWLEKLADSQRQPERDAAESASPLETSPPDVTVRLGDRAEVTEVGDRDSHPAESDGFAYPRVQRAAMGSLYEVYLAGPQSERESLIGAGNAALDEVERLD